METFISTEIIGGLHYKYHGAEIWLCHFFCALTLASLETFCLLHHMQWFYADCCFMNVQENIYLTTPVFVIKKKNVQVPWSLALNFVLCGVVQQKTMV